MFYNYYRKLWDELPELYKQFVYEVLTKEKGLSLDGYKPFLGKPGRFPTAKSLGKALDFLQEKLFIECIVVIHDKEVVILKEESLQFLSVYCGVAG